MLPLLPPGSASSPHLLPRGWMAGYLGGFSKGRRHMGPENQKPEGQDHSVPGLIWTYRANPAGTHFLRPGEERPRSGLRRDLAWKRNGGDLREGHPSLRIRPGPPQELQTHFLAQGCLPMFMAKCTVGKWVWDRGCGGPCHVSGVYICVTHHEGLMVGW